jgi:hypothetical protein
MTNKNKPSDNTVTGNVSTTNTGRSSALNKPTTKAASMAAPKLLTCTPWYRWAIAKSAAAFKSHLARIFIGLRA